MTISYRLLLIVCLLAYGNNAVFAQQPEDSDKISAKAVQLYKEQKYSDALPLAERAVEMNKAQRGEQHVAYAQSLVNLGYIMIALGKDGEALSNFSKAADILEKTTDNKSRRLYSNVTRLMAVNKSSKGEILSAEKLLNQSLKAIHDADDGAESLASAKLYEDLAVIARSKNDLKTAAERYFKAFQIIYQKSGMESERAAEVFEDFACQSTKIGATENIQKQLSNYYSGYKFTDGVLSSITDLDLVVASRKSVNGGIINGKAINLARPTYPLEAKRARISGTVKVIAYIDEDGYVTRACGYESDSPLLTTAAESATLRSRFTSTLQNGKAVKVRGTVIYRFTM